MFMGRKKLPMKRIENPTTRQATYSKRKDGILKKAKELSVLCDTDVALIMFSPTGRLTTFASNGRVEDVFLRFINRPDELKGGPIGNEEHLSGRLNHLKHEAEMLEKIAKIEVLEEKLYKLNRRQREAQGKIRYCDPDVAKINSVFEAGVYQQFLINALQRIEESKAKLLGNQISQPRPEIIEVTQRQSRGRENEKIQFNKAHVATADMEDGDSVTGESSIRFKQIDEESIK